MWVDLAYNKMFLNVIRGGHEIPFRTSRPFNWVLNSNPLDPAGALGVLLRENPQVAWQLDDLLVVAKSPELAVDHTL